MWLQPVQRKRRSARCPSAGKKKHFKSGKCASPASLARSGSINRGSGAKSGITASRRSCEVIDGPGGSPANARFRLNRQTSSTSERHRRCGVRCRNVHYVEDQTCVVGYVDPPLLINPDLLACSRRSSPTNVATSMRSAVRSGLSVFIEAQTRLSVRSWMLYCVMSWGGPPEALSAPRDQRFQPGPACHLASASPPSAAAHRA